MATSIHYEMHSYMQKDNQDKVANNRQLILERSNDIISYVSLLIFIFKTTKLSVYTVVLHYFMYRELVLIMKEAEGKWNSHKKSVILLSCTLFLLLLLLQLRNLQIHSSIKRHKKIFRFQRKTRMEFTCCSQWWSCIICQGISLIHFNYYIYTDWLG